MPKLAGIYQELGERNGIDSSSEPPEGINPGNSLISNFWSLELRENKFCCFIPQNSLYFVMTSLGNEYK